MASSNLFVHASTKEKFEAALQAGTVNKNCIAFIESPKSIWAQNSYYNCDISADDVNKLISALKGNVSEDYDTLEEIEKVIKQEISDRSSADTAINTELDKKAPLESPTFTGTPKLTTAPAANDDSTAIPSTAWVNDAIEAAVSGGFTDLSWTAGTTAGPVLSATVSGATKTAEIPAASATASGVVTTGDQAFAGKKTFNSYVKMANGFSAGDTAKIAMSYVPAVGALNFENKGTADEMSTMITHADTISVLTTDDSNPVRAIFSISADYAKGEDNQNSTVYLMQDQYSNGGATSPLAIVTAPISQDDAGSIGDNSHPIYWTGTKLEASTLSLPSEDDIKKWNSAAEWVTSVTTEDTDTVINKWNEVVAFLNNIKSTDTLDGIVSGLKDSDSANAKAISDHIADTNNPHKVTAAQVGAYTTTEVDTKVSAVEAKLEWQEVA